MSSDVMRVRLHLRGVRVLGVAVDVPGNKLYLQGAAVDFTLPAATGGDGHPNYAYTLTPDVSGIGLTFDPSTHKLTGTPNRPHAKTTRPCSFLAHTVG